MAFYGQTNDPNQYAYGQTPVPQPSYGQTPAPNPYAYGQSYAPLQTPIPKTTNQAPINQNTPQQQSTIDAEMALRNEINSGWDQYIGSLDGIIGGLGGQRAAQEGVAQSQFQQGQNTLDLQRDQGYQTLGNEEAKTQGAQKKTLRSLDESIRNSMLAGNVYLGAQGAGDSSAANQYSYALNKVGSQRRTDVMNNTADIMNDIGQRKENLTNIYNTETNNLKLQLDSQINSIAQWFQQAQQSLQMQKAQGQLSKSQDLQSLSRDLLNQAMTAVNNVQSQYTQTKSGLDQWANSLGGQLDTYTQQAQTLSNPAYNTNYNTNIAGTPQMTANGGIFTPAGYGSGSGKGGVDDLFKYPGGLNLSR